jgi:DNA-directed RNA polymerase specialized sigma24 family protein
VTDGWGIQGLADSSEPEPAVIDQRASPIDHVNGLGADESAASFMERLAVIREDPRIRSFALRRAGLGRRDIAEDALQETFFAVAKVRDPGRIDNLRVYFMRALSRQITQLLASLTAVPTAGIDEAEHVLPDSPPRSDPRSSRPTEDHAVRSTLASAWLTHLARLRRQPGTSVAGRSTEPLRYQRLIIGLAERTLLAALDGLVSSADSDGALLEAFPEWFGDPSCSRDTCYQRYSRARRDVRDLLMSIVSRDELVA